MTESEIKIYRMNDCDWWATSGDLNAAIREYCEEVLGVSVERAIDGMDIDDPEQVSDIELDCLTYVWDANDTGETSKISFRAALARMVIEGVRFPTLFGSTEQ